MKKMSISILGAGWLGLALARELVQQPMYRVKASTRNEDRRKVLKDLDFNVAVQENKSKHASPPPMAEFRSGKSTPATSVNATDHQLYAISVPDQLEAAAAFFATDVLVVTLPPGRRRDDVETKYQAEITTIINAARKNGCRHLLYTSTTGVYGSACGATSEDTPPAPATASARAVLAAEQLIQESGIPATILRLAGLYGPGRHPGRWFGDKPSVPDGAAPVNLVHQTDVVSAILNVIEQSAWNRIYNVCAAAHPPKGDYYARAAADLGLSVPEAQPGGDNSKMVTSAKIRKELGWKPEFDELKF